MKIEQDLETKERVEIIQQQIDKKVVLVGTSKLNKNHKLFEYNYVTNVFTIVEPVRQPLKIKTGIIPTLKKFMFLNPGAPAAIFNSDRKSNVDIKPGCVYMSALNKVNAIKILKRNWGIEYKPNTF